MTGRLYIEQRMNSTPADVERLFMPVLVAMFSRQRTLSKPNVALHGLIVRWNLYLTPIMMRSASRRHSMQVEPERCNDNNGEPGGGTQGTAITKARMVRTRRAVAKEEVKCGFLCRNGH